MSSRYFKIASTDTGSEELFVRLNDTITVSGLTINSAGTVSVNLRELGLAPKYYGLYQMDLSDLDGPVNLEPINTPVRLSNQALPIGDFNPNGIRFLTTDGSTTFQVAATGYYNVLVEVVFETPINQGVLYQIEIVEDLTQEKLSTGRWIAPFTRIYRTYETIFFNAGVDYQVRKQGSPRGGTPPAVAIASTLMISSELL